jgi:hypothetical protein
VSLWIPVGSTTFSTNKLKTYGSAYDKTLPNPVEKEKDEYINTAILENDMSETFREGCVHDRENSNCNHCDKTIRKPRRKTCSGDMILIENRMASFSKDSLDTKENVIITEKAIKKKKKKNEYHLILCFGGKDMVALDWLPLLNVYCEELCKINKQKGRKVEQIMSRESGEVNSKKKSYVINKVPQQVSYFHSQWLQQKRYDSLKRRLEEHKKFLNSSITPRTSIGGSMERRLHPQVHSPANSFINPPCSAQTKIGKYNFVLVEFPGYGAGIGQPCMRSCDDSGLEILRHCSALIHKPCITLHIIAYSIGCSIALRILILLIKFYSVRQKCKIKDPLDSIHTIKDLILISPFSNSIECISNALCVPKLLTHITNKMWQMLLKKGCIYNNGDYIRDLATLMQQGSFFLAKILS